MLALFSFKTICLLAAGLNLMALQHPLGSFLLWSQKDLTVDIILGSVYSYMRGKSSNIRYEKAVKGDF